MRLLPLVLLVLVGAQVAPLPPVATGEVLLPDGQPAAGGTVIARTPADENAGVIDGRGGFRIQLPTMRPSELRITVPGFLEHRASIDVSGPGEIHLRPVRLSIAPHFTVQILSPAGEPVANARVIVEHYEPDGRRIIDSAGVRATGPDPEGSVVVGPLSRGVYEIGIDAPPYARTRLPAVVVARGAPFATAGAVRLEQGAELILDIVDGRGMPLAGQHVQLEEAVLFSPVPPPATVTDAMGRARFDRLPAGRYVLRTRALGQCGGRVPTIERAMTIAGPGARHGRINVEGVSAEIALTSGEAPLPATRVAVGAETAPLKFPSWLRRNGAFPLPTVRGSTFREYCEGYTNADGRMRLAGVPAGPARATADLGDSVWSRRISVPPRGGVVAVSVPPGLASLRVRDFSGTPITGAEIRWLSAGSRVEAESSPAGDAFLAGVAAPATVAINAAGYTSSELRLTEMPGATIDVVLGRVPEMALTCRVLRADGKVIERAVVELTPGDGLEPVRVMTTDAKGFARFVHLPRGTIEVVAYADGYAASPPANVGLPRDETDAVTMTLHASQATRVQRE